MWWQRWAPESRSSPWASEWRTVLDTKRDAKCALVWMRTRTPQRSCKQQWCAKHVCLCKQQEFTQTHMHRQWSCGGVTGKGRRGSVGVSGLVQEQKGQENVKLCVGVYGPRDRLLKVKESWRHAWTFEAANKDQTFTVWSSFKCWVSGLVFLETPRGRWMFLPFQNFFISFCRFDPWPAAYPCSY